MNDKYTVFKSEDLGGINGGVALAAPLEDCFVIRASDIFGAPALYAYASQIATVIELDDKRGGVLFDDDERTRLQEFADEVVAIATRWQRMGGAEVPD